MKNLIILLIFGFIAGCSNSNIKNQNPEEILTAGLLEKYISFLASDSLKGRNTPSKELDAAADYIASEFENMGLQKVNGSYFQELDLGIINLGKENSLFMKSGNTGINYSIKNDFVPFEFTANKEVFANLVFAGYGISAPEFNYDDYENIDVKNKIVLILKHEPQENDKNSVFEGDKLSEYSSINYKIENAIKHGAKAALIVTDPLNHTLFSPKGFSWPSLSKIIPKDALPISLLKNEDEKIPVVEVGDKFINDIFGSVDSLKRIEKLIDSLLTPNSFEIKNAEVKIKTSTEIKKVSAKNVVGFLEGSDENLKDEILIIGAHYDHVGHKKNPVPGEDNIFNGADDNASGTGGIMAVAKAFTILSEKPKRSILFIAFAGEEIGLLGSEFYATNPLYPIEKTVAMMNFDMIGRNSIDELFIIGKSSSPDLVKITEEENSGVGFNLNYDYETFLGRSDHASFLKKGIPAIFYFSGLHNDYHKVTDESSLINFEKAAKVSRLAFKTAYRISNDSNKYKIVKQKISLF